MSKFNQTVTAPTKIVNRADGQAYQESPELALVNLLLTSFLKDKFYETASEETVRLESLLKSVDPEFAAKTALFARREFGLRSVTHYVAGWLAGDVRVRGGSKGHPGNAPISWPRKFFNRVIYRADDILEIASAYRKIYGGTKRLPHALGRGLRDAQQNLSDYRLAKYLGKGKDWNQYDIVRLEHGRSPAIDRMMKGELAPADTWEHAISESGKEGKDAKEVTKAEEWARLITEGKLPYFAALRNIRNVLSAHLDDKILDRFYTLLTDPEEIQRSLVFPFRYLSAIKAIAELLGASRALAVISKAVDIALANVPILLGQTLVALDCSGSMTNACINKRPGNIRGNEGASISAAEAGGLFSAALVKRSNADLMLFSNSARYISLNPADSLIGMTRSIPYAAAGTNFHAIFEAARKAYDRIIILSDQQGWMGYDTPEKSHRAYCRKFDCNPFIYSWNLAAYGDAQFPEEKVCTLAGFSDKVFDLIKVLEQDRNAMINRIKAIEL